jgi:hypothetical protein
MRAAVASLLIAAYPALAPALEAGDAAPPLAPTDIRGRALAVPAPGRVMLLSFASPATGEAAGEVTRAIRVEHPELEILAFIDLSEYPAFARGVVRGRIEKRHADAVARTKAAFARAGKTAPDDLDARIHIVPDFDAESCKAYGANEPANQPLIVLIGADGRIEATFAEAASLAEVKAAVDRELGAAPPR